MRLIDADKLANRWENLLKILVPDNDGKHSVSLEKVIEKLKEAPTVDAVPVVRCKDCYVGEPYTCGTIYCVHHGMTKQPGEFCSYGYRGDGD